MMSDDIFAPPGGWRVRILDLSGGAEDNIVEEIGGFPTLMQANAFARSYVRDSLERCREPGLSPRDVLDAWFAFGEDVEVLEAGDGGWRSGTELADFADHPASDDERDWRALDPRLADEAELGRMILATPPVVRFAPSPTGLLHVGNARPALLNWLFARRHGGRFILRLDDTDTARGKPEYETAIHRDLTWLGLLWDSTFRQMDRLALYAEAAERLKKAGRLYPCFESEDELKFKREQRIRRGQAPIYDRAMLRMTETQRATAEANGKQPYWRFKLSDGTSVWNDLVLGRREVKLGAISDPVLIRADGTPLYTFTSVVDDIEAGITHIIRGEDHISNTGVQRDIFAALGHDAASVAFAHLPLLLDDEGGKLSKRLGSVTLQGLRDDGVEPEAITSYLARLVPPLIQSR